MAEHVSKRFKALLDRAGLKGLRAAKALGYSTASGVQRHLSPAYPDQFYPPDFVDRMLALVGKGSPPITEAEILSFSKIPGAMPRGEARETLAERAIDYALGQLGHRDLGGDLKQALVAGFLRSERESAESSSRDSPSAEPRTARPAKKRGR
jgi:hypothetical protein